MGGEAAPLGQVNLNVTIPVLPSYSLFSDGIVRVCAVSSIGGASTKNIGGRGEIVVTRLHGRLKDSQWDLLQ